MQLRDFDPKKNIVQIAFDENENGKKKNWKNEILYVNTSDQRKVLIFQHDFHVTAAQQP